LTLETLSTLPIGTAYSIIDSIGLAGGSEQNIFHIYNKNLIDYNKLFITTNWNDYGVFLNTQNDLYEWKLPMNSQFKNISATTNGCAYDGENYVYCLGYSTTAVMPNLFRYNIKLNQYEAYAKLPFPITATNVWGNKMVVINHYGYKYLYVGRSNSGDLWRILLLD
jgi:hypothetical protein